MEKFQVWSTIQKTWPLKKCKLTSFNQKKYQEKKYKKATSKLLDL